MSYLKNKNNKIIVDAILTDYGKKKLAAQGKLDIYKFSVADDEVDYALWNESHPQGSDYYNSAIVNLPTLQPLPGTSMIMKYQLFTPENSVPGLVEEMVLTFDSNITGSGVLYDRLYPITPSIVPPPGDITRIFYEAYITTNGPLYGASFKLDAIINSDIGITPDIQKVRDYYANASFDGDKSVPIGDNSYNVVVGHGFTFRALNAPRTNPVYIDLHIIPHKVSARKKTIKIKLPLAGTIQIEES